MRNVRLQGLPGRLLKMVLVATMAAVGLGTAAGQALANHVDCGDVITGDTKLDSDVRGCPVVIGADDITLDLAGHVVDGVDNRTGYDRVTVRNGAINGRIDLVGTSRNVLTGLNVSDEILLDGFDRANSTENRIQGSSAGLITLYGSYGNTIERNRVTGGSRFPLALILLDYASENVVARNVISHSPSTGIFLHEANHNEVVRNRVSDSQGNEGIFLGAASSNRIERNEISGSASRGLVIGSLYHGELSDANVVTRNHIHDNGHDGILLQGASFPYDGAAHTLVQKNALSNNGDDGIDADSDTTTLTENVANVNFDLGIEAVAGVTDGGRNRARGNGNEAQCTNVDCK